MEFNQEFEQVKAIRWQVKQGHIIRLGEKKP